MEVLLMEQEEIGTQINKGFVNYKKTGKDRLTSAYIDTRLESLEQLWAKFTANHFKIMSTVPKAERTKMAYCVEDCYNTVEETYIDYKTRLKLDNSKKNKAENEPAHDFHASKPEVKLPQIQLPTFSGAYEEWQSFHDMFKSLIHSNDSLSAVQKLHYLKSGLKGEPEMLLRSLSTTEVNYTEAWDKLVRRYSNKRYNANEIMKRLFSQKYISNESATSIKNLLDTTAICLKSLKNLGIRTDTWDVVIIYITVSKLDYETRMEWETEVSRVASDDFPTWDQLVEFLEKKFRTLEMLSGSKPIRRVTSPKAIKTLHSTVQEEKSCVMCNKSHLMYQCKQFGSKSSQERSEFIQSKRLCFNCFAPNHTVKNCHQATCCRRCGRRHHTLLHLERSRPQEVTRVSTTSTGPASDSVVDAVQSYETPNYEEKVVAHFAKEDHHNRNKVLLATALVKVKSQTGYYQTARVLIDQGSEASFVTESVVQTLGLKHIPVNGLVTGVGEGKLRSKYIVNFELESLHNPEFSLPINAFVLTSLTSFLPSSKTFILNWPDLDHLPLADPYYGSPGKIDIILGVEGYSQILLSGFLKHPTPSGPVAQNTQLGWILSGKVGYPEESTPRVVSLHLKVKEENILKQFWEIEREPDVIEKKLTKEERRCEEIYETTTTRTSEGRYIVRLPFRDPDPQCMYGKSKDVAMKRFMLLERKLSRNSRLRLEYTKVMNDYLEQNHMEEITNEHDIANPYAVYLPHHAVVREDKETTKVRVVFDASCKGVNNVSLNESLKVGPKLQQDLRHILMRWRTHPYCVVADITQMYRQVVVNRSDVDFQRILWRDDPEKPIRHFRLLRLTFGIACAPYLAVKSLQQLAKDEQLKYPLAAKLTLQDYYVDDLLTGCETDEEAIDIYKEINKLMGEGGFRLQKWCSNSQKLLSYIEKENQNSNDKFVFKINDTIKVLGISWNKNSDIFEYTYNLPKITQPVTKRRVVSEVARLYDPMGWVAPVLITAKILIQKLWKSGLNWDDNLTPDLLNEWICFREELNYVKMISLPRWLSIKKGDPIELHVFADASQVAYAAVVYIKSKDKMGNNYINIVTAKTKVAPVDKQITVPRLELCAALLGAKLLFEVSQILKIPKEKCFAWSDSTVVLAWLRGEPSRWTTFVSNRVSEILIILDCDHWNHIPTDQNPADCASRGTSVRELREHELWWYGPKALRATDVYSNKLDVSTDIETRPIKALTASIHLQENFIWLRFSNLSKMLRVLSYCMKFLKTRKPETKKDNNLITVKEMDEVLNRCLKATQELYFEEDIKNLRVTGSVTKKNQLHSLSPILDQNGLLRVGGRIMHSSLAFDKKCPIILPSDSHITKLIIMDAHNRTLHGGPQIMQNFLRSKYWIIRAREKVKKCYRDCVICVRHSRQNNNQFMGQLPKSRLTPTKPFLSTGVDFTGHIDIRFSPGRGARSYKGYICLFVCMSTKAIHLEAVSDLTSSGFIAAFKRFVSRRGRCQQMFSDNGTNFVGADKELRDMFNRAKSQLPDEIAHLLTETGTTWHFVPPHAPNFGGLWEAGVRSTKTHLKRVIGNGTLTFEELTTVLTQVEACLNSRPLSFLSENPDDPMPLTPGHFLVGEPLITIPEPDYTEIRLTGLQRWRLTQKMVNDFWRKWSDEYLVTLNHRYKWFTKKVEPEVNDIVVIRDHNIPPARWLLGKIVEKHPGKDNITRVVSIKTKNGICKRPCNKLCFLPKAE